MVFLVIYMFNLMNYISRSLSNGNIFNIFFCKIGNPQNLFGKIYKSTEHVLNKRSTRKGEIATDEYS